MNLKQRLLASLAAAMGSNPFSMFKEEQGKKPPKVYPGTRMVVSPADEIAAWNRAVDMKKNMRHRARLQRNTLAA